MKFFEVVSGRPSREAYHRAVYVAFSLEKAEECLASLEKEAGQYEDWLWGPHIHLRDGDPAEITNWNGFELEPAPEW